MSFVRSVGPHTSTSLWVFVPFSQKEPEAMGYSMVLAITALYRLG